MKTEEKDPNKQEFPGAGEWERKFAFLDDYGMGNVYKLLLIFATSVNNLRDLHSYLPENARLHRDQLIDLVDFWIKHVKGTSFQRVKAVDPLALHWMLSSSCPENGLRVYYSWGIRRKARTEYPTTSDSFYMDGQNITCHEDRAGHGVDHFRAELFGSNFRLGCTLSHDSQQVFVKISTNEGFLTEELAHNLESKMPEYDITNTGGGLKAGRTICYCYGLPSATLLEYLAQPKKRHDPMLASPEFTTELVHCLCEIGVPITGDIVALKGSEEVR